jgi:hypothetical protein
MDRRLVSLPHIAGDFSKISVEPSRRAELEARYGRSTCAQVTA